ncbi:MAG: multidrug efflux RND transporter permease subunit [Mariniblastus sp.]|nr:multidrug efflux RND transporter permease subunit [Mariniblastus sp.]
MSEFFIKRPIFASVISIIIVMAGIVSFTSLPVAKFPQVAPPVVQVNAVYPGANAQVIAETVATVIEQEVNGVENMLYMSSTSADDGSYSLQITFALGTDMDMANVLVQNRVSIASSKLPEEVRRQGIVTQKQSTQILQMINLTSDNGELDELFLSNYALSIKDELSRINGVGSVKVFGAGDYSMRVWLDPSKLKSRNITTDEVVNAIREQNVQVAAGQIGGSPAPVGTDFQYSINTLGRLSSVQEFEDIIVRSDSGGRFVRVRDVVIDDRVGENGIQKGVEIGAKDYTLASKLNGSPCATVAIYQLPDANALAVATQVKDSLEKLKQRKSWPAGVGYSIPFDTTKFVEASIEEVYSTIFIALILVVLVIYIFLQDWRATVVPVVAIPVSLIGTFAVMAGLGFSLNMLSLFGIVLAIGIVVDDAIVVVESTSRYIAEGMTPKMAAITAMREITGPIVATTLVLLAVFVPTAFMAGITGQLFKQFALTISAAVLISTINALTLSPALCGIVLRAPKKSNFIFFRWFNRGFDASTNAYRGIIRWSVRLVLIVMLVFGGLVTLTGWSFSRLPTGFVPMEDQGYMFVNVQLPDAASKQRTVKVMDQISDLCESTPGVKDCISITGFSLLSGSAASNVGFVAVMFEPWSDRTAPPLRIGNIVRTINAELQEIDAAIAFPFIPPPIDGLGNAGGFQMEIEDIGNAGYQALQQAADMLVVEAGEQPNITRPNSLFRASTPQLFIDVDRVQVKAKNIPLSSVFSTLQAYLGSAYVNDFNLDGRTYQVRIQADAKFRATKQDILDLEVRSLDGNAVPMGTLINITEEFGPSVIRRYQMYPSASINGSAGAGISSGQALDVMEQLADQVLPDQFRFEWTGLSYQEKAAGGQAVILALAIIAVFLVLAAQYESWTMPAAVIAVVPLAALGVVAVLTIRGADVNVYTQIGIVLLVALASKNAILIVEFASEKRKEGLSIADSAVEAARLRFRAILMTAFSSILGFLPLLIASGAGAASRQAVGNAVVGGMMAATLFSLLFVPTFFVIFRRLGELGQKPDDELVPALDSGTPIPTPLQNQSSDTEQPVTPAINQVTAETPEQHQASSESTTGTEPTEPENPAPAKDDPAV